MLYTVYVWEDYYISSNTHLELQQQAASRFLNSEASAVNIAVHGLAHWHQIRKHLKHYLNYTHTTLPISLVLTHYLSDST